MMLMTGDVFESIRNQLEDCSKLRLHRAMAPELSYGRHRGPCRSSAKPCGVMVALVGPPESCHIPLMLRPESAPAHPGQVSLPGGRLKKNEPTWEGSLREFEEELGIPLACHRPIGPMSSLFVFASRHIVFPWLSRIEEEPTYYPNAREVREILRLPLNDLMCGIQFERRLIRRGNASFLAPGFQYGGLFVWGATAMILNELRVLIEMAASA